MSSSTETCREPGKWIPQIDRSRCEAKADCVRVCPYDVFEVRAIDPADKAKLGPLGKLKLWVHGGRQAYAVKADDCHACGLCVKACPEKAISLRSVER